MTSINYFPTFQYSQPEDYKFSHDSVFLARHVFEFYRETGNTVDSALDLCAGCGIVGMDFLYHCRQSKITAPYVFDFLEVQNAYWPHFEKNQASMKSRGTKVQFINENYSELLKSKPQRFYDLILCNPPYFFKGHGKLPTSELKMRSRFFIDSDFNSLIFFIQSRLSITGKSYILVRNQEERKISLSDQILEISDGQLRVDLVGDIRGTDLVCLSRIIEKSLGGSF